MLRRVDRPFTQIAIMRNYFVPTSLVCAVLTSLTSPAAETPSIAVGTFTQEVRREFAAAEGLPANAITSVAVLDGKTVLAGTTSGLARFANGRWATVKGTAGAPVEALVAGRDAALFALNGRLL
jgi:hypothetical protein